MDCLEGVSATSRMPVVTLLAVAALSAGLEPQSAQAAPLVVTNGQELVWNEADDSPVNTDGARIGPSITGLPGDTVGTPTSGTLIVGEDVVWNNTGQFSVGHHVGIQENIGTVIFMPGSVFNNTVGSLFDSPSGSTNIGGFGNAQGFVTLHAGAIWNQSSNQGQVNFNVNESGSLLIEGKLLNQGDPSTSGVGNSSISGAVTVSGPGAEWRVGGQNASLDVDGFGGSTATLDITGGGRVYYNGAGFVGIGMSAGSQGHVSVGGAGDSATSVLEAGLIELGTFSAGGNNPSQGTLTISDNGQVEVGMGAGIISGTVRLGRSGGVGNIVVHEGGEMRVASGSTSSFFTSTIEIWQGSTIDLSDAGSMFLGSGSSQFPTLTDGTLHVNGNGQLKGTGTIIGDVVASNGGIVSPGHSIGSLAIDGSFDLGTGVLNIEIGSPTDFDQLLVSGVLTLGGTLNLSFIDGFSPGEGEGFMLDIFGDSALDGAFDAVTTSGLDEQLSASVDMNALASGEPVSFTIVPEPASALLLGAAGLSLLRRRR